MRMMLSGGICCLQHQGSFPKRKHTMLQAINTKQTYAWCRHWQSK